LSVLVVDLKAATRTGGGGGEEDTDIDDARTEEES
jgi:hypothetical protein